MTTNTTPRLVDELRWQDRALCKGMPAALFYGVPKELPEAYERRIRHVKAICAACVVQPECLAYALRWDEREGVWGGVVAKTRQVMRNRLRKKGGLT